MLILDLHLCLLSRLKSLFLAAPEILQDENSYLHFTTDFATDKFLRNLKSLAHLDPN